MRVVVFALALLTACGGGSDKRPPAPDAPTELVACPDCGGLVRMPIIADGLTPGPGWSPHPITATLRFISIHPSGYVVHTLTSKPYTPKGMSTDGDLASTLNVDLPGAMVLPDTSFSVWLTDADQGKSAQPMD